MLIQFRKKFLKFSSSDNKISSKNVTFDIFFAMIKMFMKLIFEFKYLLATTTNMKRAFECISRCEIVDFVANRYVCKKIMQRFNDFEFDDFILFKIQAFWLIDFLKFCFENSNRFWCEIKSCFRLVFLFSKFFNIICNNKIKENIIVLRRWVI